MVLAVATLTGMYRLFVPRLEPCCRFVPLLTPYSPITLLGIYGGTDGIQRVCIAFYEQWLFHRL
jgi:hypothetical protein